MKLKKHRKQPKPARARLGNPSPERTLNRTSCMRGADGALRVENAIDGLYRNGGISDAARDATARWLRDYVLGSERGAVVDLTAAGGGSSSWTSAETRMLGRLSAQARLADALAGLPIGSERLLGAVLVDGLSLRGLARRHGSTGQYWRGRLEIVVEVLARHYARVDSARKSG